MERAIAKLETAIADLQRETHRIRQKSRRENQRADELRTNARHLALLGQDGMTVAEAYLRHKWKDPTTLDAAIADVRIWRANLSDEDEHDSRQRPWTEKNVFEPT